jgi:hypothetical protein
MSQGVRAPHVNTDGNAITANGETLQPWQEAKIPAVDDVRSREIGLVEQALAPREPIRAAAAATLAATDPEMRLVLRRHPVVPAVIINDVLIRAIAIAKIISFRLRIYSSVVPQGISVGDLASALVRHLDRALVRDPDLDGAVALARDLALTLDLDAGSPDMDRALAFALALADALVLSLSDILRSFSRDRARSVGAELDGALVWARARALTLARDLDRDSYRTLDLHRALDLALDRASEPERLRLGPPSFVVPAARS